MGNLFRKTPKPSAPVECDPYTYDSEEELTFNQQVPDIIQSDNVEQYPQPNQQENVEFFKPKE